MSFVCYLFFSEAILTKASKQEAKLAHVLAVVVTEGMRFLFVLIIPCLSSPVASEVLEPAVRPVRAKVSRLDFEFCTVRKSQNTSVG